MPRPVQLTPNIEILVEIHQARQILPQNSLHLLDYFIGETTGLFTHLTYSGAVYYGRKALKPIKNEKENDEGQDSRQNRVQEA